VGQYNEMSRPTTDERLPPLTCLSNYVTGSSAPQKLPGVLADVLIAGCRVKFVWMVYRNLTRPVHLAVWR